MNKIPMKQLLEVGAHFGHQTRRWNPKMKPYIYGARTGIYIIDLQQTVQFFNKAYEAIRDIRARGKSVLFVGTKRQAQDIVREEALRCGQFYANYRWLGGTLTNFKTVKQSVERLKRYDAMKDRGYYEQVTKKEALKLEKERVKLEKVLGGIKDMDRLPGALFIVDAKRERIAIQEADFSGFRASSWWTRTATRTTFPISSPRTTMPSARSDSSLHASPTRSSREPSCSRRVPEVKARAKRRSGR